MIYLKFLITIQFKTDYVHLMKVKIIKQPESFK